MWVGVVLYLESLLAIHLMFYLVPYYIWICFLARCSIGFQIEILHLSSSVLRLIYSQNKILLSSPICTDQSMPLLYLYCEKYNNSLHLYDLDYGLISTKNLLAPTNQHCTPHPKINVLELHITSKWGWSCRRNTGRFLSPGMELEKLHATCSICFLDLLKITRFFVIFVIFVIEKNRTRFAVLGNPHSYFTATEFLFRRTWIRQPAYVRLIQIIHEQYRTFFLQFRVSFDVV